MNVPGDEPSNWVAMILPMFWFITIRDWRQLRRSDEHIAEEYDGSNRYQAQHGVEMEHILELVPLPSANQLRLRVITSNKTN